MNTTYTNPYAVTQQHIDAANTNPIPEGEHTARLDATLPTKSRKGTVGIELHFKIYAPNQPHHAQTQTHKTWLSDKAIGRFFEFMEKLTGTTTWKHPNENYLRAAKKSVGDWYTLTLEPETWDNKEYIRVTNLTRREPPPGVKQKRRPEVPPPHPNPRQTPFTQTNHG